MSKLRYFLKIIINSYFWQFTILTLLAFLGFYKIFTFTFHHNREIVSILPVLAQPTIIKLMKSHVFIHFFNYHVFGLNVWGWYLTGLILHLLATFMIVVFVNTITKKRTLGFLAGLWFVVSTAWHDTVTFGTQESLVAGQLFLFLTGIFFYSLFRQGKKKWLSYPLSLIFFLMFTPLRESGLLFYPLLFVYDLIFYFPWQKILKGPINRKNILLIVKFLLPLIPFFLISLSYIVIRNSYGGSPDDASDGRIKFKIFLLLEGKYLEYIKYGIISFGFYLPPHIIPYQFVNILRNLVVRYLPLEAIKLYFFSTLGYIYYFLLVVLTIRSRGKAFFKTLLFALSIITIPTLFYSFAFTPYEPFFLRDYGYDENRWRYVAFFGTSLFLIVYFSEFFKKRVDKKLLPTLVSAIFIGNLLLNIGLMWSIEDKMYNESFKPQKLFYSTFLKTFPTFENNYAIYAYPKSDFLGDYMWEWFGLKKFYYPNLTSLRPDWGYGEINRVLKVVQKDSSSLKDFFFIDFQPDKGVINYTTQAREMIRHQESVVLGVNKVLPSENKLSLSVDKISPVEFPYNLEITLRANFNWDKFRGRESSLSQPELSALIKYYKSHTFFLNSVKVLDICSGAQEAPSSVAFIADHLTDGNFGPRSMTYADCFQGKITLDLGEEHELSGVIMGGIENDPHLPFHYIYEVSRDGNNWEKVMEVEENRRWELMDKWSKPYKARYLRVKTISTQTGIWLMLDEIEPVLAEAVDIFNYWSSRQKLTNDLHNLFSKLNLDQALYSYNLGVNRGFARFYWKTNLSSPPEAEISFYFPYLIDGKSHTYTLPVYESEFYSGQGQFLKRYLQELDFDFSSFLGEITIDKVKLLPKIETVFN